MTWLLSVLIVLACIGGIIFIPFWVSVLVLGRERGEEGMQWILGAGITLLAAFAIALIIVFIIGIHDRVF